MKISTLINHLSLIKEAHGDMPVWVEVDYFDYDDNISKNGPILDEPLIQNREDKPTVILWANAV